MIGNNPDPDEKYPIDTELPYRHDTELQKARAADSAAKACKKKLR
jgi:hypothetical protein